MASRRTTAIIKKAVRIPMAVIAPKKPPLRFQKESPETRILDARSFCLNFSARQPTKIHNIMLSEYPLKQKRMEALVSLTFCRSRTTRLSSANVRSSAVSFRASSILYPLCR